MGWVAGLHAYPGVIRVDRGKQAEKGAVGMSVEEQKRHGTVQKALRGTVPWDWEEECQRKKKKKYK